MWSPGRAWAVPHRLRLVELGPGRGTLMRDILRAARAVPPFLAAAIVHLVEISAPLRGAQRQTLGPYGQAPGLTRPGEATSNPVVSLSNHGDAPAAVLRQAQDEGRGLGRRSLPDPGCWCGSPRARESARRVARGGRRGAAGGGDCHRQRVPRCASYPTAGVRRRGVVRACGRGRWARRATICGRRQGDRRDGSAGTIAARRNNSRVARGRGRSACPACQAREALRRALHRLRSSAAGHRRHLAGRASPCLGRSARPARLCRPHGPRPVRAAGAQGMRRRPRCRRTP